MTNNCSSFLLLRLLIQLFKLILGILIIKKYRRDKDENWEII